MRGCDLAKKLKATIVYTNYADKRFEKKVTGTREEIEAEAERMESLPDVAGATVVHEQQ